MPKVVTVPADQCVHAADLFGSKPRPDTIEISVDLVYQMATYTKALMCLLGDHATGEELMPHVIEALAQLDEYRHFKAMRDSALAYLFSGKNAVQCIAVESEDTFKIAEDRLVASGYFRRSTEGLFLERADQAR